MKMRCLLINPQGPTSGVNRVLRGGCWDAVARRCRVSSRDFSDSDYHNDGSGMRLSLSVL
ncbi:MAG: hypothetical protein IKT96_03630 [Paludibacteraceae bacterium]|nr:hypothetical protein [Paludibacteraceae bacterium]